MTALHKDVEFIARTTAVLEEMRDASRSLEYATVLTDDGFEVSSIMGNPEQHRRVASMASSMQALGDAVSRDLHMGDTEYLIIAASHGNVIQLRVPGINLVLAAHFDMAETVGKALSIARLTAASLGSLPIADAA